MRLFRSFVFANWSTFFLSQTYIDGPHTSRLLVNMNDAAELCLRDQVFEAAASALDAMNEVNSSKSGELVHLKEGLRSLRDTLLGAYRVVAPEVDSFYYLCLQLCNYLKMSCLNDHVHGLEGRLVLGYSFGGFQEALLASCHALDTYLNIIRCAPGKFDDNTKNRCMACVSSAIRDLEKHQAHLNTLDDSVIILSQGLATSACLSLFYKRLLGFGVDRHLRQDCGCVAQGSNRISSWKDDITISRVGRDAMEHFASFGEMLLKEITRRRTIEGDKSLADIMSTFNDMEKSFQSTLHELHRDEYIMSKETVTRGYRLEFMGMSQAGLLKLGFT